MKSEFDTNSIRDHIYRVFPHAKKIDIKINRLPNGVFKSLIRVRTPHKKEIVAQKIDENIKKSLDKTYLAVIKQIDKIKTRWSKKNNNYPDSTAFC